MLNLPEFEVNKKEENEYYYKFTVVAKYRPFVCTQYFWIMKSILLKKLGLKKMELCI